MRKALIAATVAAAVLVPAVAASQDVTQTIEAPPVKPEDIAFYCIYGNKVYSPGAQLCVEVVRYGLPAQAALLCKPPSQAGGRASWDAAGTIICSSQPAR
jgi:hypothetical protein